MDENPYKAPKEKGGNSGTRWCGALVHVAVAILGVSVGGAGGGIVGWLLGDFGGRSDPENVGFFSFVVGAALGLAIAIAVIFRRAARLGWSLAIFLGTASGAIAGTAFVLLVYWRRRP
jgi:hypothetical protein